MKRPGKIALALMLACLAAQAHALMGLRNLTISPEFICPGQKVTLTFQESYATSNGNWTWGVFSTNNAIWDDPNDYEFMSTGHANNGTAASSPGTPADLQTTAVGANMPDGFWHTYTWVTTIPASIVGTNITFLIKGNDGAQNWAYAATWDAEISITTQLTCTEEAIYNNATLLDQSSSARLVIKNSCGTPSFTPTSSNTPTRTSTRTSTATPSPTPTSSQTATNTDTMTATPTRSSTATPTATPSYTPTVSPSATRTATPTATDSITVGPSPTDTPTFTVSPSSTGTGTDTATATSTDTATPTPSATDSPTATVTSSGTDTASVTPSVTETTIYSATNTPSATPTFSATLTPSASPSATDTASASPTATISSTPTGTATGTDTPSASPTGTQTMTVTFSPTLTSTPSASPTFTVSPTNSVSPTASPTSIPMPFSVQVVLYNAAGERVRVLFNGSASSLPQDITLSSPTGGQLYQIGNGAVNITSNGVVLVSWNGSNDNGQAVTGGSYYFKVEFNDQFGQTTSFIKNVQVIQGQGANYLAVYNSAGEEVSRQDLSGSAHPIMNFSLSKGAYGLVYDAHGADQDPMIITTVDSSGAQVSRTWAPVNERGQPLSSGTYTVKLVDEDASGVVTISHQVTLIKGNDPGIAFDPIVAPNPAPAAGIPGIGRSLQVVYPTGLFNARADMYDQAGERVGAAGDPGSTGKIWLSYESLASGVYLIDVTGTLSTGAPYRKVLKAAVLH